MNCLLVKTGDKIFKYMQIGFTLTFNYEYLHLATEYLFKRHEKLLHQIN